MCKARSAHVLRTSAEKRKGEGTRGTDASTEEGTEGLTDRLRCRFLLYQEENELAVRPILPWQSPFHGRCAQKKKTCLIGSQWGQTPSQIGFSHKLWKKPAPAITRQPFPNNTRAETSSTIFHTLQDIDQRNNWILEVLFPKC